MSRVAFSSALAHCVNVAKMTYTKARHNPFEGWRTSFAYARKNLERAILIATGAMLSSGLRCPSGGTTNDGPPDDCGGILGFYELLEADPTQRALRTLWNGRMNTIPIASMSCPFKYALSRIANRRNAAKARIAKSKRLGRSYRTVSTRELWE
jgi:hypothetical protein